MPSHEIYVKKECPIINVLPKIKLYSKHSKIRIGYFSADFHDHATMHLMAELFECHDKKKFELIAFSFGPDKKDEWRQRVLLCFDQFVDVRLKSDQEISLLARKMEIDIAIDSRGTFVAKTVDGKLKFVSKREAHGEEEGGKRSSAQPQPKANPRAAAQLTTNVGTGRTHVGQM